MTLGPATDPDAPLGAILTPQEVSDYLDVPVGTLANWRYLQRGPRYLRIGRHVRYRAADVAAWLDTQLAPCNPDRPTSDRSATLHPVREQ